MKTTKIVIVAVALIVALSLAAPVSASCNTVAAILTIDPPNPPVDNGRTFIFSPVFQEYGFGYGPNGPYTISYGAPGTAPTPFSTAATVSFWSQLTGNPAIAAGDDNGTFDMIAAGGFYPKYGYSTGAPITGGYWYGAEINSGWQPAGIDGCINGGNCMCLLISDHDGNRGFWAVTGGQSSATFFTSINQGGSDGNGNNLPIVLATMPTPAITNSVRVAGAVDLTVKLPAPTTGDFTNAPCECAPVGFKVFQQIVMRGSTPPSDRNISDACVALVCAGNGNSCASDADCGWTEPTLVAGGAQGTTAFGIGAADPGVTIRSACDDGVNNKDVWLTTQLVWGNGFTTTHVSGNSARVECGPVLADPDDRPKVIRPRSKGPTPRRR